MFKTLFFTIGTFFLFLFSANVSYALNGLYGIGFGTPSKGMGGAAVAFPQDTLSGLTNPANLVAVGTRLDMAVEYIRGTRIGKIRGNTFAFGDTNGDIDLSRNKNMIAGEAGFNYAFCNGWISVGLLVAPQAGGALTWSQVDPFAPAQTRPVHIDLNYVSITPTLSFKFLDLKYVGKQFLGVGVDLTPARLKISGLGISDFQSVFGSSAFPNNVTNKGWNWTFGYAIRAGWLGQFTNWLSLGFAYRSKTWMSAFDRYKGAITPGGEADLPASYFGGILIKPFRQTAIAFDVGRILNGDVKTFANPPFNQITLSVPYGSSDGAGFSWKDMTVYKVGITQNITDSMIVRAGYNYGTKHVDTNIGTAVYSQFYLPSTTQHHITLGVGMDLEKGAKINAAFIHGFKHSFRGPNQVVNFGGGKAEISTDLYRLEVEYSKVW